MTRRHGQRAAENNRMVALVGVGGRVRRQEQSPHASWEGGDTHRLAIGSGSNLSDRPLKF